MSNLENLLTEALSGIRQQHGNPYQNTRQASALDELDGFFRKLTSAEVEAIEGDPRYNRAQQNLFLSFILYQLNSPDGYKFAMGPGLNAASDLLAAAQASHKDVIAQNGQEKDRVTAAMAAMAQDMETLKAELAATKSQNSQLLAELGIKE